MNPTTHASNNAVLHAPPGMSAEECQPLSITRLTYADGTPAVASFWQPTPDELARLAAGAAVLLISMGHTHPPLTVLVDGDPHFQL